MTKAASESESSENLFEFASSRQQRTLNSHSSLLGINHLAVLLCPFDGESDVRNLVTAGV